MCAALFGGRLSAAALTAAVGGKGHDEERPDTWRRGVKNMMRRDLTIGARGVKNMMRRDLTLGARG